MIWYLLYPLRGTTEPPDLAPSHILRSGFARYGRYVASHVITALLVSATVGTILIYPIPYLFTSDFVNGASNLPHHVWTVAQPLSYDARVEPDVIMRSIWVHSSYMEALNPDVLVSALELQDALLGPTKDFNPGALPQGKGIVARPDGPLSAAQRDAIHIANGLTNQSWFFHSPLLYWGCSREKIIADPDLLSTINDRKQQSTSANITLRHSIVFSGKRFEDRRLVSADALVITLLHLRDSPVGRQWEQRAFELPQKVSDRWDVYPSDGRPKQSQLYEFQFRPLSAQDILSLGLAYGLALVYFLMSLSKLRALKSKFGLIVTIITQIAFSIMSSFTVCAVLNVDLSRIPQAAYPLVVLSMSLENIFRLINAAILTPPEDSTSNKIGHAFGKTAPIALASSMQNVLILAALSRMVSPSVSAFCVFAAVALIFDFFYLSTFFLSVLSVDVRRMELGDALAKTALRQSRRNHHGSQPTTSWFDQVLRGKIALSTRIAGTVIMIGFVVIAQWHFFGDDHIFRKLLRLYKGPNEAHGLSTAQTSLLKGLHQARSPTSWLLNQDHETAQEVIRAIKPDAYSYVARVFDPLVFVKRNSDRVPHSREPTLLPAAYDFMHHQSSRFVVIVVIIIAALRLLMNYLLWEDDATSDTHNDSNDYSGLSVKTLGSGHALDVAMLCKSTEGHIVSVGLDRVVRVWDMRGIGSSYVIANGNDTEQCPFPILAMAVDESSQWLALLSPSRVALWSLKDRNWGVSIPLDESNQRPEAFFFDTSVDGGQPHVVMLHRNGTLVDLASSTQIASVVMTMSPDPLLTACVLTHKGERPSTASSRVVTISRRGKVYMATRKEDSWAKQELDIDIPSREGIPKIVPLPNVGLFGVATVSSVYLIDAEDGSLLRAIGTERMAPRSFECVCSVSNISAGGPVELSSLTICYTEAETGDCIVRLYVPRSDCDGMRIRISSDGSNEDVCTLDSAKDSIKRIHNPGFWDTVSDGSIVGLRRIASKSVGKLESAAVNLRHRHTAQKSQQDSFSDWEVWAISGTGKPEIDERRPLFEGSPESASHLVISELGPKVKVGLRSVAFSFGNVIKLVTVGSRDRFGDETENANYDGLANTGSRRRKQAILARTRLSG